LRPGIAEGQSGHDDVIDASHAPGCRTDTTTARGFESPQSFEDAAQAHPSIYA